MIMKVVRDNKQNDFLIISFLIAEISNKQEMNENVNVHFHLRQEASPSNLKKKKKKSN